MALARAVKRKFRPVLRDSRNIALSLVYDSSGLFVIPFRSSRFSCPLILFSRSLAPTSLQSFYLSRDSNADISRCLLEIIQSVTFWDDFDSYLGSRERDA